MISLLVPSRGRASHLALAYDTAEELCRGPEDAFEMVCYLDDDDPEDYGWVVEGTNPKTGKQRRIKVVNGPRIILSDMWNKCAEWAEGDIFMVFADDVQFRTFGWNELVEQAFGRYVDKIMLAYGFDGRHTDFGTHPFVHRRWFEILGYVTPPYFCSDFGDSWMNDVAEMLNRRVYIPGLFTEHLHPSLGTGIEDRTHKERLERAAQENPRFVWEETKDLRDADAEKLDAHTILPTLQPQHGDDCK